MKNPDSVANESKFILRHRFRYSYRITGTIYVGRASDVNAIVLLLGEIDSVTMNFLDKFCLDVLGTSASREKRYKEYKE